MYFQSFYFTDNLENLAGIKEVSINSVRNLSRKLAFPVRFLPSLS